jgi:hypothetical protein
MIHVEEYLPCRRLWLHVVYECLRTATGSGTGTVRRHDIRSAQAWFGTADFRRVCQLADLDPSKVMALYRAVQSGRVAMPRPFSGPPRRRVAA